MPRKSPKGSKGWISQFAKQRVVGLSLFLVLTVAIPAIGLHNANVTESVVACSGMIAGCAILYELYTRAKNKRVQLVLAIALAVAVLMTIWFLGTAVLHRFLAEPARHPIALGTSLACALFAGLMWAYIRRGKSSQACTMR